MKLIHKIGLVIMALAAAAMVLADLMPIYAAAAEARPGMSVERSDGVILLAQADGQTQQQKPKKRKTLLELLFGGEEDKQGEADQAEKKQAAKPKNVAAAPPPPPKVPKAENATRVAVFGDSLAEDVGRGLDRFYSEDPNLKVVTQSRAIPGWCGRTISTGRRRSPMRLPPTASISRWW
jgi:hypothetical protein